MYSVSTAPTMNLVSFRSMLGLLERSCAGITPTRQSQSRTTSESVVSISVTTCQPENGSVENTSLELLGRCTLYSSKHNRSSDDVEGTLSLCKSLLNSSSQNAIVPNEDAAVCVPPPKVWMFLALGLLLLKELIALNFVQKSLLEERSEEQRRSAEELQILLQRIAEENFPSLLLHSEPRLRKICSEVLYVIACNERVDYKCFIEAGEARLGSVIKTIHFPLYHSTGSQLLSNVSDNLHRISTSRRTNLGNEPLIPLDDTTGWLTLESSIIALHEIVRGYGAIFYAAQQECINQNSISVSPTLSIHELLISQASNHKNPHIKESAFEFIRIICTPKVPDKFLEKQNITKIVNNLKNTELNVNDNDQSKIKQTNIETNTIENDNDVFNKIVDALSMGMEDNWCHIRRSAIRATKNFLLSDILLKKIDRDKSNNLETGDILSNGVLTNNFSTLNKGTMSGCWGKILPGLCMSRFYVADGVCALAKDAWNGIINKCGNGRIIVATYLTEIINYYILMSKASNHMVSEAALLALSECLLRIDKSLMLPHIDKISQNILLCIHSDSWPVKDSATIASGSLLKFYASECKEYSSHIVESWCESLKNSIWSVRENAAIAFGENLKQILKYPGEQEILQTVLKHINENIFNAKKENLEEIKHVQFIPPEMLEFMLKNERKNILKKKIEDDKINQLNNPVISNIESNEENVEIGNSDDTPVNIRVTWGCCLDCMELRSGSPWEASDGCIYLIRELSSSHPVEAITFLPKIYELLLVQDYKVYHRLSTTILSQLPLIYTALNTSTVSTDDTVRNPESSSISYHVHSTLPTTLHTMDVIQQQSTLGVNGILDPVSFSVISPEYQAPLVIQDHSVEDFEQPIPSISIPSLSLGNPRKGSGRGRGRGSGREGGSEGGDANTSNPLDLSDNRSLKENYLNGTSAAKMFIEEHASLIHRFQEILDESYTDHAIFP